MNTDWQTKTIAPNGHMVQVDCNSGAERHIQHASCKCGQAVLIEFDAKYSSRRDRKRVFYAASPDNLCAFRCRGCHEPVSDCVPGANYDVPPNAIGQGSAACGASPAPTGCAANGTNNERTDK